MAEEEGFKMSMAEFKGTVIAELRNIKEEVKEVKTNACNSDDKNSEQHKEFYVRIRRLEQKPTASTHPFGWVKGILNLITK